MTDSELEDFGQQIADACEAFLLGLQAISSEDDGGAAVPLLLLEVSQLLLAGARLGAQRDFQPESQYQPDVGPDPDLDAMRMRLADKLGDAVERAARVMIPRGGGAAAAGRRARCCPSA